MIVNESAEVKRYRAIGAALRVAILLGVVAGLAAIGSQAPQREYVTLHCAYDPSATGTMTDAVPEIPGLCDRVAAPAGRPSSPRHEVPDAASSLGSAAGDEIQPPTF